ncbi:ParB/RepB/Spo0J family partition protein [Parvicella tangerina]|uniref:Chromosome-partitioning protein ParB n=1 Tax=Parvicella tangerina TaxID=2829795 RepID=A0A916NIB7_9FLAO|nr:ParB/RepB/Spo0J family partition protein [Parvicella tangerina]CAG5084829.1 putative chromosome-partitioning protein ParB [Parvicella tangerina]
MSAKKPALGKGLGALLDASSSTVTPKSTAVSSAKEQKGEGGTTFLSISQIEANPFQPRAHFDKDALEELKESILLHGVIQPITVRKIADNKYQIISGERRFRASKEAGLKEIPVFVRTADDQTMLEMAIIENVQRKDLNAIEVALSYQRLIDECNITQEKVGERVSKSRASVTNYLRLLNLPVEVQAGIRDEKISMGHARALLSISDEKAMIKVYRAILDQQLSVRKVEDLARRMKEELGVEKKNASKGKLPENVLEFQENLSFHLKTKVKVVQDKNGKGKITIDFSDQEHLDKILNLLDN